jgi:hypothetical protein
MKSGHMLIVCHKSVPNLADAPLNLHDITLPQPGELDALPIAGICAVPIASGAMALWEVLLDRKGSGAYHLVERGTLAADPNAKGRRFRLPTKYSPLYVLEVASHMMELEYGITINLTSAPVEVPLKLVQYVKSYHPYQDLH